MWDVFYMLAQNLGMSFEDAVLIVVSVGNIIFFALDVRRGLLLCFIVDAAVFLWFYAAGLNWVKVLITVFIFLVLMAISIYTTISSSKSGGGLV